MSWIDPLRRSNNHSTADPTINLQGFGLRGSLPATTRGTSGRRRVHCLRRRKPGRPNLQRSVVFSVRSRAMQARLAKISAFLGSLECIRNRDLALATIEGGMAVVQSFQSETPPTLETEEARLSGCKGDLAVVDGNFDLILVDLKSTCFLLTCSEGPEGKDPVLGEGGGDAASSLDEATGEEGV
ncbi:hypothetical protein F2Q68_00005236 [Brassica cretica]|uniref:Uncharacterized protein n=1 Tax=Brassica cretica TaxID=69181 RepID=A0A8S9JA33_BRACR|nr:hypothetical protein F2Q68_00005236 [Brassica cretica]